MTAKRLFSLKCYPKIISSKYKNLFLKEKESRCWLSYEEVCCGKSGQIRHYLKLYYQANRNSPTKIIPINAFVLFNLVKLIHLSDGGKTRNTTLRGIYIHPDFMETLPEDNIFRRLRQKQIERKFGQPVKQQDTASAQNGD